MNDSLDTFDGNDIDSISKMKFQSLRSIIKDFIEKLKDNENNYILKMSNTNNNNNNQSKENNKTTKQLQTTISENNEIIQKQTLNTNKEGVPFLSRKDEYEIKKNI